MEKLEWLDNKSKSNISKKLDDLKLFIGMFNKTKEEIIEYFNDVSLP